jgi:hypothetical protein
MSDVKLYVLQCVFQDAKYFISLKFCILENDMENEVFWNNFVQVKITHFTRILHCEKSHVNIKFYNIIFHKEKILILPDLKPKIKLHVLIKNFAV